MALWRRETWVTVQKHSPSFFFYVPATPTDSIFDFLFQFLVEQVDVATRTSPCRPCSSRSGCEAQGPEPPAAGLSSTYSGFGVLGLYNQQEGFSLLLLVGSAAGHLGRWGGRAMQKARLWQMGAAVWNMHLLSTRFLTNMIRNCLKYVLITSLFFYSKWENDAGRNQDCKENSSALSS